MNWQPNYSNVPAKASRKSLLDIAFASLYEISGGEIKEIDRMKDKIGTFAIETSDHVLTAKKSPYGYIVSIDEKALNRAKKKGKKILIYIDSSHYYYEFRTEDIDADHEVNYRGEAKMINFSIKLGINYVDKMQKVFEIARKNYKENELKRLAQEGVFG